MSDVTVEDLRDAIREADTSGQWSKALDLIRTDLVDPLERERDAARADAAELWKALEGALTGGLFEAGYAGGVLLRFRSRYGPKDNE